MTDARVRLFWHRAGPLAALAALTVVAAAQGCGGGTETTSSSSSSSSSGSGGMGGSTSSSTTSTTTTSTTSSTGTGGSTPFMGMLGPIADARTALDATPDPAGNTIYFIAIDPTTKAAGVYKAPSDGSAMTPVVVASGAPFATPFGIATSTDGMQLYIADPGATDTVSKQDLGVIFSLPVGGGTPTILSGSELFGPRSLEVAVEGGKDVLYYTGRDKTTGVAGVFKIPASGGASTAVTATGVTFVDPSGIAIASDGTVYVADTTASASRTANIVKIDKNGTATTLLSNLQVGYPCGVAVSKDDKTLLISALDSAKGTDVLLQVDIATAMQGMSISMGIDTFTESAGLHRAKGSDMYAWADSSAGASNGRVFVVK